MSRRASWVGPLLVLGLAGCGGPGSVAVGDGATPLSPGAAAGEAQPVDPDVAPSGDGDLGGGRVGVDDDVDAITGLDAGLRDAVGQAAAAAAQDDVVVEVTSGWRSREHQQRLLDEAVQKYGSAEEAARWVATPDTSAHVTGDAVDVGPTDAAYWMAQHGSDFGLCQVYANEIWHYELLADADGTCPPMRADGTS